MALFYLYRAPKISFTSILFMYKSTYYYVLLQKIFLNKLVYYLSICIDLGSKICSTNLIHSNNLTAIFENYVLNSKKLGTINLKILF